MVRSPAAFRAATALAAPGKRTKSSGDRTYSPSAALTLMVPSRSRKTVRTFSHAATGIGRAVSGRENSAASTISQIEWPRCRQASWIRPVSSLGHPDADLGDVGHLAAPRPVSATVVIPASAGRLKRANDIR